MPALDIALLGPPQVTLDGKPVDTDRRKAIGLLAYLAVEARSHSREVLAALLWPDYPRSSAFSYLRRTLWELNQVMGKGWINSDRGQVALAHNPGLTIDVEAFQGHIDRPSDRIASLTAALNLYRGDFLETLVIADTAPFEDWQTQQAGYYRGEFTRALRSLVEIYEQKGEFESALLYAQRWLSLDRLNESAYRAVMRQLAGMGNRSDAIRLYQAAVQTLRDELGVDPQEETLTLYQSILHGDRQAKDHPQALSAPSATGPKRLGYLPSPSTPFIGRADEINQVVQLTCDPSIHLLTLVGPGGTGKTRLSIQAASEITGFFPDGVWFIPLATIQSVQGLVPAIAKGLTFQFIAGLEQPRQQLLDYLREKHLLLLLDNFEHLVEGGRDLLVDILNAAPRAKLLITSRQRLNLQTEQVYLVPGMRTPHPSITSTWDDPAEQSKAYSAVQLLLERARRVRPGFQLTRQNMQAVIQICHLVDGSPLGIVLAGAWLELLPPDEIVNEITRSLDFLESNAADIPERQRSLRAVFNSSWNLLNADEQKAFRRLCLFQGNFSRQAAQEVGGCSIQTLLSLVNKSWLLQADDGRYLLHEVMKQFGMEHLQADQAGWRETKDKHAAFFSAFMQVQGRALRTSGQVAALKAMKIELDNNLPDAWQWLVEAGQLDILIEKMLPGLFHYWLIRSGSPEFISLVKLARKAVTTSGGRRSMVQQAVLETVETSFELTAMVYDDLPKERLEQLWRRVKDSDLSDEMGVWYLVLIATYGSALNFEEVKRVLVEMLPGIGSAQDPWELGFVTFLRGQFTIGETVEIHKKYLLDALEIFQKLGVVQEQGSVLLGLSELAARELDYEQAIAYGQKAKQYLEQVGDEWGVNVVWNYLAEFYIYLGKLEQAFQAYRELKNYSEKRGNRRMLGTNYSWESLQLTRYGSLDYALEMRKKSLEISIEVHNQNDTAYHTWELGEIYRLMGDLEQARKYYRQALALFEKLKNHVGIGFYHRGCGEIAMALGSWSEARTEFELALEFHQKEQPNMGKWGLALYHSRLGVVLVHLGELAAASQHLKTSLGFADGLAHPDTKAVALTGVAHLLLATGKASDALVIASCVIKQLTTWNEVKKEAGLIIQEARGMLSPHNASLMQEHGEAMSIDALSRHYLDKPGLLDEE